jgi:CHAD domain-containing protein
MASGIIILRHWNRQVRKFNTCLGALKKQYNSDSLHDLRVSVKKLRAYLDAIHLSNKEADYTADFKSTENLFKLLGKHRDLELGLGMLKLSGEKSGVKLEFFSGVLQNALQRSNNHLQPVIEQFDENALASLTLKMQDGLKDVDSNEFSRSLISTVKTNYERIKGRMTYFDHHIHDIRKSLKNIHYQAEILPVEQTQPFLPLSKTKKILDHLGDWQDHEMLVKKMKHFRQDFIAPATPEFNLLKQVEKDLVAKKEDILKCCRHIFNRQ